MTSRLFQRGFFSLVVTQFFGAANDNVLKTLRIEKGDVEAAFAQGPLEVVIMGAGISLDDRLEIIQRIFELSDSTTVHMKDRASGQPGMMPFVNAVLQGLTTRPPP